MKELMNVKDHEVMNERIDEWKDHEVMNETTDQCKGAWSNEWKNWWM